MSDLSDDRRQESGAVESIELDSKSFRQAVLRSERTRIIAILIVLSLLWVSTAARRLVVEGMDAAGLGILTAFFAAMIAGLVCEQ